MKLSTENVLFPLKDFVVVLLTSLLVNKKTRQTMPPLFEFKQFNISKSYCSSCCAFVVVHLLALERRSKRNKIKLKLKPQKREEKEERNLYCSRSSLV